MKKKRNGLRQKKKFALQPKAKTAGNGCFTTPFQRNVIRNINNSSSFVKTVYFWILRESSTQIKEFRKPNTLCRLFTTLDSYFVFFGQSTKRSLRTCVNTGASYIALNYMGDRANCTRALNSSVAVDILFATWYPFSNFARLWEAIRNPLVN